MLDSVYKKLRKDGIVDDVQINNNLHYFIFKASCKRIYRLINFTFSLRKFNICSAKSVFPSQKRSHDGVLA